MREIIAAIIILAVVFLAAHLFRKTYTPPETAPARAQSSTLPETAPARVQSSQASGQHRIPLTCAIVFSESQRKRGDSIPDLSVGPGPSGIALIRPFGEMLLGFFPTAGKEVFKDVRLVSSTKDAETSNICIELQTWNFGKDTGCDFWGLPLLLANGKAWVSVDVDVEVSGPNVAPFRVSQSAKETLQLGLVLFPFSRVTRSMTEAADLSAASVSRKLMETIAKHPRLRTIPDEQRK